MRRADDDNKGADMIKNVLLALLITTATVALTKSFLDVGVEDFHPARVASSGS